MDRSPERFSVTRRFPALNVRAIRRRQLDSSTGDLTLRNRMQRTLQGPNGYAANRLGIGLGARRIA